MTIFASAAMKLDVLEFQVSGFVGEIFLWIPTRHMTTQTFRVMVTFDPGSLAGIGQVKRCTKMRPAVTVVSIFPDIERLVMTLATNLTADVPRFTSKRHGLQSQFFQSEYT